MNTAGAELQTRSPEESLELGRAIGRLLRPGDCVALFGELGSGKTLIVKGLAQGLGSEDPVVSPTFNLMLEYRGRVPIRHLDAYFASREIAFLDEACGEVFDREGVAVVEWAERILEYLPPERLEVRLEFLGPQARRIRLSGLSPRGEELLRNLLPAWNAKKDSRGGP